MGHGEAPRPELDLGVLAVESEGGSLAAFGRLQDPETVSVPVSEDAVDDSVVSSEDPGGNGRAEVPAEEERPDPLAGEVIQRPIEVREVVVDVGEDAYEHGAGAYGWRWRVSLGW
jgi:hypothetical protein